MANITFDIECNNVAPLKNLKRTIKPPDLKLGIFANNGSGKTFISRMFRVLENNSDYPTDALVSFGSSKCSLKTKIIDKAGVTIEDFILEIKKGVVPILPNTHYIYHTFNSDYVEENVRNISYEKDGERISGYVLGKEFIDISKEEEELKILEEEEKSLNLQIVEDISNEIKTKLDILPNVKSIGEYKAIVFENITNINAGVYKVIGAYEKTLEQYNSIKSIPADLQDIISIDEINYKFQDIKEKLEEKFDLSKIANDFKLKVQQKQNFVEDGLKLKISDVCPFCEQKLSAEAIELIDLYNAYLNDTEAKTIKLLDKDYEYITLLISLIHNRINIINDRAIKFNDYKSKYVLSMQNEELHLIDDSTFIPVIDLLESLKKIILEKIKNISTIQNFDKFEEIEDVLNKVNSIVKANNNLIEQLNARKNNIKAENLEIRREICKIVYNDIQLKNKTTIDKLALTKKNIETKKSEIKIKQETSKQDKKELIASTIQLILNTVFRKKYTFDKKSFKLSLNTNVLAKSDLKNVLSDGEKSLLAFAYYLGDVHQKVNAVSDYERVFFIIDDPISSLDFNYVYSICGIIRDLNKVFEHLGHLKYIILTHNTEFMRIMTANKMLSAGLLLKEQELKDYKTNFSVPYISHLHDVYKISLGELSPSHTTANSIRHILETIVRFENCVVTPQIKDYIETHFDNDKSVYTLINDLSHGALRYDQSAINDDEFGEICKEVIRVIEKEYNGQIEFIKKL